MPEPDKESNTEEEPGHFNLKMLYSCGNSFICVPQHRRACFLAAQNVYMTEDMLMFSKWPHIFVLSLLNKSKENMVFHSRSSLENTRIR